MFDLDDEVKQFQIKAWIKAMTNECGTRKMRIFTRL